MDENRTIKTYCTSCHAVYRVPDHFIGKRVACKKCGNSFEMVGHNADDNDPVIGKLALQCNFINERQFKEALSVFKEISSPECLVTFEDVLVEKGLVSPEQLRMLCVTRDFLETRQKDKLRGADLVEKGQYTRDQVEKALADQSKQFKATHAILRIDDILTQFSISDTKTIDERESSQSGLSSVSSKKDPRNQAAGRPGENPPDLRNAFLLSISDDKLFAFITRKKEIKGELSLSDVQSFLKLNGIVHGVVDDDTLQSFLEQPVDSEKPFKVAEGTEPEPGSDAKITYYFAVDPLTRSVIQHSGCVEFSPPGENLSVKAGDTLAEKIGLKSPKPGMDVLGRQIPYAEVRDYPICCGEGAILAENGLKVVAEIDGQPDLTIGGKISVLSDLRITGDIEPAAGPIRHSGNIIVSGSIKRGVTVKGGSLTANEIVGAEIDVSGKVSVANGIIDTRIRAQSEIQAKYIKNAKILTYGDVAVEKEIMTSEISTSGECLIPKGTILSSVICAWKGILAGEIGSEMANPSTLRPGVDAHVEKELEIIRIALDENNRTLTKLKKAKQTYKQTHADLHQKIAQLAQVEDRSLLERRLLKEKIDAMAENMDSRLEKAQALLKQLEDKALEAEASLARLFDDQEAASEKIETITNAISGIQTEITELQTVSETILKWSRYQQRKPSVTVEGEICEGTVISGLHATKTLPTTYNNVLITETRKGGSGAEEKWEFRIYPRRKDGQDSQSAQLYGV